MSLILLEALAAAVLLVLIVWWTMFSGRRRGELDTQGDEPHPTQIDPGSVVTKIGPNDDHGDRAGKA